jgi:phytoene dehydrogenase-like protein
VGSGPNGLAAAIVLAQSGVQVTVLEAKDSIGGGMRTQELTLPGFHHDVCSAIHPLAAGSPFFSTLPLAEHGLQWIEPEIALAHPFDDGSAVTLRRSLGETARLMGRDARAYHRLMEPLASSWGRLAASVLGPVLRPPRHPLLLARFGLSALRSASGLARSRFGEEKTRALFAGLAAHANVSLGRPLTAGSALVLAAAAHAVGWPIARSGSQALAEALASYLGSKGGEIKVSRRVASLREVPDADAVLFDVTPRQLLSIAGERLSAAHRKRLERFRYGPGVFKVDYALDGPIPWAAGECRRAGTVHVGGTIEEIQSSEECVSEGRIAERPYVIVAQQSLFDPSRAPAGKHTTWAYCHVPNGSSEQMADRIDAQIERFAPGFRDRVLARHVAGPAALEASNENYVGGDIGGGAHDGLQLLLRPTARLSPYSTSNRRLFICSASTPPGGGVHGMCGYFAAQAALRMPR